MKHIIKYLLPGMLYVFFLFETVSINFDMALPFLLVYFFCFFMILLYALLKKETIRKLILVLKYLSALIVVGVYTYLFFGTDGNFPVLNQIFLTVLGVAIITLFFMEHKTIKKVS